MPFGDRVTECEQNDKPESLTAGRSAWKQQSGAPERALVKAVFCHRVLQTDC